jgi:branched-chain amino acid transport system permease protein
MALFIQIIFAGLANGATYGLAALGLTFIYRVTGMLNFSQGVVLAWSGLSYARLVQSGVPVPVAALSSIAAVVVLTAVIGFCLRRWFGREHELTGSLITLGITVVLQGVASITFGKDPLAAPSLITVPNGELGGAVIRGDQLIVMACALLASLVFWLWIRWTDQGKMFTALVDDPLGAQVVGFHVSRLRVAAFTVGGLLAGVAGVAITPANSMAYNSGETLLLNALTASAVGGISNPLAAVIGGIVVGLVESVVAAQMGSLWQLAVGIAMLMVVLTLRPEGLLAMRKARSV